MKHQQVVPDYAAMVQTSGTCLCLVFSGWVLFKLVQAIFWLPGYLEKNQGRLYRQLDPHSASDTSNENGSSQENDRLTATAEGTTSIGEDEGESVADECEADSKKDK
ncbi:uncharacterized protein LOC131211575 [Anopheles bellator]|uniref:uncharacterized protein LOC131211575 n=1 Tax=Anopheles bellator TaxID=139047 RepID=UPI002649C0F0|nr:uncharacterized protein LOC131211575 [Anopheles bellator]